MKRVLVVDDDREMLKLVRIILEGMGFAVHCAGNGKEALDSLMEKNFDIVITDFDMPGMNGLELSEKIFEIAPHMLIVMVTGELSVEISRQAVQKGIAAVLPKPYKPNELLRIVKGAVS